MIIRGSCLTPKFVLLIVVPFPYTVLHLEAAADPKNCAWRQPVFARSEWAIRTGKAGAEPISGQAHICFRCSSLTDWLLFIAVEGAPCHAQGRGSNLRAT